MINIDNLYCDNDLHNSKTTQATTTEATTKYIQDDFRFHHRQDRCLHGRRGRLRRHPLQQQGKIQESVETVHGAAIELFASNRATVPPLR
jgi:hypothetical protein